MKFQFYSLLALTILILTSCGMDPEEQAKKLVDSRWLLEEVGDMESYQIDSIRPNHIVLLTTTQNSAMAFAGCNTLAAKFELEGTSLVFSNIISTKKNCEDMELENRLKDAISRTDSYRIKNNKLTFFEGRSKLAEFQLDEGEYNLPIPYDLSRQR